MSTQKIKPDDLAKTIMDGLEEYKDLVVGEMKDKCKNASDLAKKEIKANAPKRTGAYAKSWTVKKTDENSESVTYVVHSKKKYRLTHLLENGHATRNGGRTKAQPHIKPAEEKAIKSLTENIERVIKNV